MPARPALKECFLAEDAATVAMGRSLAAALKPGMTIFLEGPLGVGKTTFCRGILQFYGYRGSVKSPTYTLVEPYEQLSIPVYHFDLYRLGHGEELEYIGVRDYFTETSLCLVEWPTRAKDYLPPPDFTITLTPALRAGHGGRQFSLTSSNKTP